MKVQLAMVTIVSDAVKRIGLRVKAPVINADRLDFLSLRHCYIYLFREGGV